MSSSASWRKGISSLLKMLLPALALFGTIISVTAAHSANTSNQRLRGTGGACEHLFRNETPLVSCYSYTEIPTDIAFPGSVTYLEMSKGNVIDILTNGSLIRSYLNNLKVLNLDNCKIRVIEQGAFAGSHALAHIYLGNNLITVLNPDVFADVLGLKVLLVDNNPINMIEQGKTFQNLTELTSLDLSNCKLEDISSNVFENMTSFQKLNLTGNNFKRLDWRVLQSANNLKILNLEGNPWHCDCHVKFLMEELKNKGLAKSFDDVKCNSTEKYMYTWRKYLWTEMPDEYLICPPKIDKFTYSSWSQRNEHENKLNAKESLQIGEDVFFECEYSGFPRPKVRWYKDYRQQIKKISKDIILPAVSQANIEHRVEFMDDIAVNLPSWEQGGRDFNYKFREILVVHRIQMEDEGTYACDLDKYAARERVTIDEIKTEINTPCKADGDESTLIMWKVLFFGLLFWVLIAGITVIVWIKRGKQEEREVTQESGIDLAKFDVKPIIPHVHLNLKSEDSDTSLWDYKAGF